MDSILAIDQGTSATKCVLVDRTGAIVARGSAPLDETHPQTGWVEQDPEALWVSVQRAVADCLRDQDAHRVAAIGIASQRESLVAWDRASGAALAPLVSWQDQRGAAICDRLRDAATEALVRARSGLPLDPMFSAAKATALLDALDPQRERARAGAIALGTVDAWLLHRLAGPAAAPVTEIGNASRTQLLDVRGGGWDPRLLELFGVPRAAMPDVVASTGPFPAARGLAPLPNGVPVLAVMGDSHAALYAHGVRAPGQVKATYGTGSSVMGLLAGAEDAGGGVCLTIAWQETAIAFAAEGNVRATGATVRWLAGLLGATPDAVAAMAAESDSGGVVLVPGFNGLGAPYWDREAVGLAAGLRLDTGPRQLARAALDSIVHQVADVAEAMGSVDALFADGGASRNDALMQMQADVLGCTVLRARDAELSALGVAHLAGRQAEIWDEAALAAMPRPRDRFAPKLAPEARAAARAEWRRAVARARSG
ncbi:MAG TPA: FGGY family carbohydrate kinase [Acetobacteraceae bacterium]|nr:FGGY family carbohydrate kinase [Acetobacteraceae bacterium]